MDGTMHAFCKAKVRGILDQHWSHIATHLVVLVGATSSKKA